MLPHQSISRCDLSFILIMLRISAPGYLILPCIKLTLASASSPCYYPDGTYQSFDSPCFPDQAVSFCCGHGHSCMSNGLCRWPDADMPSPLAYVRGSCTDKSCTNAIYVPYHRCKISDNGHDNLQGLVMLALTTAAAVSSSKT
jgi:hypothetical protein